MRLSKSNDRFHRALSEAQQVSRSHASVITHAIARWGTRARGVKVAPETYEPRKIIRTREGERQGERKRETGRTPCRGAGARWLIGADWRGDAIPLFKATRTEREGTAERNSSCAARDVNQVRRPRGLCALRWRETYDRLAAAKKRTRASRCAHSGSAEEERPCR